ncbi:MAG: DedA family protein [Salinivirgaceae bacterium]|nr:DedA family protein [Salinivirgaceae bacterium]
MLSLNDLGLIGLFIGNFLAATVVPFSSDALYIGALAALGRPTTCFVVATIGNWLGSIVTYYCGRLAKWEWIEKTFRIEPQTIARHKAKIDRFGMWLALLAWVPFIGDALVLALGFYRTPQLTTFVLLLIGKAARFLVWTALLIH